MSQELKYLLAAEAAALAAHAITERACKAAQKSYVSHAQQEHAWDIWRDAVDAEFRALQEVERRRADWRCWTGRCWTEEA